MEPAPARPLSLSGPSPRYAPAVSHNVGGIWVGARPRGKKPTQVGVARAIATYWTQLGAVQRDDGALRIEPLSMAKGDRRLGYAVLPESSGWIAILDSERYTADFGLARHLAEALDVEALWFVLYGATDSGVARWFGSRREAPADGYESVEEYVAGLGMTAPFPYFDALERELLPSVFAKTHTLAFRNVPATKYDHGPEPKDHQEEEDEDEDEPSSNERVVPPVKGKRASRASATKNTEPPSVVLDTARRAPFEPIVLREKKTLIGQDTLRVFFSCRVPVKKMVRAVEAAMDAYLELVPQDALRWALHGASSTTVRKWSASSLSRARSLLDPKSAAKKEDVYFFLAGDERWPSVAPAAEEPESPLFLFHCDGTNDLAPLADHWRPTSKIEMRFPSSYLWQLGVERFVEFVARVGAGLPLESGLASIALTWNPLTTQWSSAAAYQASLRALERHGLDLGIDHSDLGDHSPGARWLTLLGGPLIAKLGGKRHLKESLDPGVGWIEAGEHIVLRAGAEPHPDPSPDDRKLLRSVARAIRPVTLFSEYANLFEPREDAQRWFRRFLD
jgi:hypothetical protein